jgi:hypothetical protein
VSEKYTTADLIFWLGCRKSNDNGHNAVIDTIIARLRAADETEKLYHELIFEVARAFPDETRHETARRHIRQAEILSHDLAKAIADYKEAK